MLADYPLMMRAIGEWLATAQGVTGLSLEEKDRQFRSLISFSNGKSGEWVHKPLGPTPMNTEQAARDVVTSLENMRVSYVEGRLPGDTGIESTGGFDDEIPGI